MLKKESKTEQFAKSIWKQGKFPGPSKNEPPVKGGQSHSHEEQVRRNGFDPSKPEYKGTPEKTPPKPSPSNVYPNLPFGTPKKSK